MARRLPRSLVAAVLAGAALLGGCASDEPYAAPQQQPRSTLPRAPVVAPSAPPSSPFFWPLPDSWWPFNW